MDDTAFMAKVIGCFVIGAYAIIVWVVKSTLANREAIVLIEAKATAVEQSLTQRMTVEDVRKVVEEALDRRDRQVVERRKDYDALHEALVRRVVAEELNKFRRDLRAEFNLRRSGQATPPPRPATPEGED